MEDITQVQKNAKWFVDTWTNKIKEKRNKLSENAYKEQFWRDLLENVFNIDSKKITSFIEFEKSVKHIEGTTGKIDAFIKNTKVLIEQKSSNIDITNKYKWKEAFSQAGKYARDLHKKEKPRWIVVCNFKTFSIYDMKKPNNFPIQIFLKDLENEYKKLNFLINKKYKKKKRERISKDTRKITNNSHNTFSKQYKDKERKKEVKNINTYSRERENVFIEKIFKPLNNNVPKMHLGCVPLDGGNLIIEEAEYKEFIKKEPKAKKYIKKLIGSTEFLNNKKRYCLWLEGVSPEEIERKIESMPLVKERVEKCREFRLKSSESTRKLADTPYRFRETYNYNKYMVVPIVNIKKREYIPMGFNYRKNTVSTSSNLIIKDADLYHFGILESIIHMKWVKFVCDRPEKRYKYSAVVYNNFPWPEEVDEEKRRKIEETAQGILDARAKYPDKSLDYLYGESMPKELKKAHEANDKAVKNAYKIKNLKEEKILAKLKKMYTKLKKENTQKK